jgi:hypothetical protein
MSVIADRYREWTLECPAHGLFKVWAWSSRLDEHCPTCHQEAPIYIEPRGSAPGIATDDIPGGMQVRHGICWPDGTPRRVDSKTELKRALNEAGLSIKGDTPSPYKVSWSGRVSDPTGASKDPDGH